MAATASLPKPARPLAAGSWDYRTSHTAEGYGDVYQTAYRRGYFHYQWEYLEKPLLSSLLRRTTQEGRERLMDFACGTGRILRCAEQFFDSPLGVDVSESMLEVARREGPTSRLLRQDLTEQVLAERFDVVTAFRFFTNADDELRTASLKAINETLVDGGLLIANVHVNSRSPVGLAYRLKNWIAPQRTTPRHLGPNEFSALLAASGFSVRQVEYYSYLPRTGPFLPSLARWLMPATEWCCRRAPISWLGVSSCFVVVAEKRG